MQLHPPQPLHANEDAIIIERRYGATELGWRSVAHYPHPH